MLKGCKILVVNPNHRLNTELAAIEPPLWAGLCASYHNADILDAEGLNLTLDETETRIRESREKEVLIVVMGNNPSVSSTPKMPVAEALAERIRDLDVSLTGIHPIAVGSKFRVVKIPFWGFPMMPWSKLPMDRYRAHNWHCLDGSPRSPYASIYTSLGCPFECYYCPIHTLYGNRKVQFRLIKDIIREVDVLVRAYRVKNIKIWDELFALDEERVITICSGLKDYDLNMWAYARIDTITGKMLKSMKEAGINWLAYGFESIKDSKFVSRTEDVIKMTRDAGINIIANFMFGLPDTTPEDDRESLEFAKKHLFEFINFYDAKPYPGSEWFNDIREAVIPDYELENEDWREFSQYSNQSNFRRMAFKSYFSNPAYIEMISKKFGEQAVVQIETMLEDNINVKSG